MRARIIGSLSILSGIALVVFSGCLVLDLVSWLSPAPDRLIVILCFLAVGLCLIGALMIKASLARKATYLFDYDALGAAIRRAQEGPDRKE